MSLPNQANGKKSSNSSIANTPASTPVTTSNGNTQTIIHNSPPPNNNAPKYGTLVPNRIFVGGISANTTEGELLQLFSTYGTVKAAKIIQDRAGVSKGYGFITFESEDDAKRPLREADNIVLRERKLNIAPAIKKQLSFTQPFNFNRAFDGSSPPTVAVGNPTQYFLPPGAVPYFQGGVSYYAPPNAAPAPAPGDPSAQQPTVYQPPAVYPAQTGPPQTATYPSMMFPAQTIYMPQQYPMPMPYDYNYYPNNGAQPQYMVGTQGGPGPQGPPMPPSGSPPRPPCFNQQISYTTEPVFYNVPMYGGPMDHPQVYTDAIENATNPYGEEPFMGQFLAPDLNLRDNTPNDTSSATTSIEHHQNQQNITSSTTSSSTSSTSVTMSSNNSRFMTMSTTHNSTTEPDTTRQTNTPVVSLLSIDHSQEKDLNSMQGGRKKKPLPAPTPTLYNGYPPNHHHTAFPGLNYPPPPLPQQLTAQTQSGGTFAPGPCQIFTFNNVPTNQYNNGPVLPPQSSYDYSPFKYAKYPQMNGVVGNCRKIMTANSGGGGGKKQFERRSNNERSSLRTDSNSSATSAALDENRNHEDKHRTNVTTPPPAPYSPLTNHGYPIKYNGMLNNCTGSRMNKNYHNHNNQTDTRRSISSINKVGNRINSNFFRGSNNNNNNNNNFIKSESTVTSTTTDISNNNNVGKNENEMNSIYDSAPSQVHGIGGSGGGGGGGTASFGQSTGRRGRRSIRRNNIGTGTNSLSEIGAGDAPLPPNSDPVSETCKKFDSMNV